MSSCQRSLEANHDYANADYAADDYAADTTQQYGFAHG
jgi:hypothetical protein